jgi:hypothetical protein
LVSHATIKDCPKVGWVNPVIALCYPDSESRSGLLVIPESQSLTPYRADTLMLDRSLDEPVSQGLDPQFPGFTEYTRTRFLCCDKITIPAIPTTYFGQWEISFSMPSFVLLLILSSYGFCVSTMLPRSAFVAWLTLSFLRIPALLFTISYVPVITDGPGFFPFYHPMPHCPREGAGRALLAPSDDHSPSGIISAPEQKTWAKTRPRPNRCILSTLGRRIVIRPDHFCGWTESWIGKRNYKFFLLFNVWGSLYVAFFLVVDVLALVNALEGQLSIWTLIHFLYAVLAVVFLIMMCMFVHSHGRGLVKGQTQWEIWNQVDPVRYDEGCTRNVEDVCGTGSICCWCCPVSPWNGMTNMELIARYRWNYGKDMAPPEED